MVVDCSLPLVAGSDAAIVPGADQAISLHCCELGLELIAQILVSVGVGDKDIESCSSHSGLPRLHLRDQGDIGDYSANQRAGWPISTSCPS